MDFAEKPPHNSDPFSLLHGPGPGPETPRKTIHAYLQQLSREHDLELPWDDTESPSKRRRTPAHDVAKDICFLYFQDRAALDVAIEEFRRWLPFGNVEEKLTYLLDRLTIARTNCMKKRTPQNRSLRASPQRPAGAAALPEPLSPTLSIKHAPNSRVEMPADDFQLPPVRTMRRPSLKTSRSNQSMTEKIRVPALNERQPRYPDLSSALHFENAEKKPEPFPSSGEMAPPRKRAASRNAGLASVNISFTSTNAGLTSADTSFWSEVHQGTQDPESPATSIGDSFHTPDAKDRELDGADDPDHSRMTTNYGSSPKLDDDDEPLKHDEARPRKTDGVTESTQSEYGGAFSLPTQSYDEIFAHMGTQRAAADNDRHLTPSPPHTNPRSETHELTGFARVEKIVRDGLRNQCLPAWLCDLPFEIRWEAARILQTKKISSNDLCLHWQSERDLDSLYSLVRQLRIPFVPGDKGIGTNSSYVANMRWAKSATGPVFDLELLRPARDKSTSLERKFGRSNFLYINLTPLSKCHKSTKLDHYEKDISDQVLEMFQREQHLLGRVWRQFHVQVRKSTTAGDPDFEKTGARQFFLFAVRDEGKDDRSSTSVPIVEVWDWAVPCCKNLKMRVPKAFARVDLMASRTLSGHRLAKDEIVRINDFMPTSDPDDTTFDEAQVLNAEVSDQPMNDGCNRIATWLMVRLVRACNLNYLPSAVQGRINGAKGVWYRDNGNHLDDEKPDKLLWISDSQTKVLQTDACWDDDEKMTFNVVRFSGPTGRAELYADFIRIMADRKVPWSNICKAVMDSASEFVQPFKDAYENPGAMRFWMHCQNKFHEERNRANGIDTIGGFPVSREEHINHLLETGFDWRECEYLANEISAAASTIFGDAQVHLRLEMLCATMPLGIVDETGVVAPGEVHFIPSKPFNDAQGVPMMLRGRHTVVGRLPALGPSDMQKMRIVQKESLAHLVDVLVFSRKGPRSQASKLQGGDYDGDMFWICWDPSLVEDFKNVPVSSTSSKPKDFGILVNTETVGDLVRMDSKDRPRESDVLALIAKATKARMRYNPLGSLTLALEKLTYDEGSLDCEGASELFQIHGLMIDSDKQGYTLPKSKRDLLNSRHKLLSRSTPAFRRLMQGEDRTSLKPKSGNVLDHIFFNIIGPTMQRAIDLAASNATIATSSNLVLTDYFLAKLSYYRGRPAGHKELLALPEKVDKLKKKWQAYMGDFWGAKSQTNNLWRNCIERIRKDFESITPSDPDSDVAHAWLDTDGSHPAKWDLYKAGALVIAGASSKLMFSAAGKELSVIMADARGARVMTNTAYGWQKVRNRKRKIGVDDVDAEYGDDGTEGHIGPQGG